MYEVIINGELYHHGVKGMKWGVRKLNRNMHRNERKYYNNTANAYATKAKMNSLNVKKHNKNKKGKEYSKYEKKMQKLKQKYDDFIKNSKMYNKNISELTKAAKDQNFKTTYKKGVAYSKLFYDRTIEYHHDSILNNSDYVSSRYKIAYDKTKFRNSDSKYKDTSSRKDRATLYKQDGYIDNSIAAYSPTSGGSNSSSGLMTQFKTKTTKVKRL